MTEVEMKADKQRVRPSPITVNNLMKMPFYLTRGVRYHAAGRIYTPKPIYLNLRVTQRCNSMCVMCSDWKSGNGSRELTVAQIGETLRNPLFGSVKKFALSGGEPVIREELVQIAETALQVCPSIKEMLLLTNGLEPALVLKRTRELIALHNRRGLSKFAVSVSVDGCGDVHEKIRRVPQAFERVSETVERLKELQRETPFYLGLVCVVQPLNIEHLVQLSDFIQEMDLPITFVPVYAGDHFVKDPREQDALRFTAEQLDELKLIFDQRIESRLLPADVPFWREYFAMVDGRKRKMPCFLCYHYARLDSDGNLYSCYMDSSSVYGSVLDTPPDRLWFSNGARETRKRIERDFCPKCTIHCDMAYCFSQEFFYYAGFLLKEKGRKLFRM
jgi:MoaA/NifB/PqqE/SkfB family radical SAM enzyme